MGIVTVVMASGVAMSIFEAGSKRIEREAEDQSEQPLYEGKRKLAAVTSGCYDAWTSQLGGTPFDGPKTKSGQLFNLAFGFFSMVVLASYTSSMTSAMVSDTQKIASALEDLLKDGK